MTGTVQATRNSSTSRFERGFVFLFQAANSCLDLRSAESCSVNVHTFDTTLEIDIAGDVSSISDQHRARPDIKVEMLAAAEHSVDVQRVRLGVPIVSCCKSGCALDSSLLDLPTSCNWAPSAELDVPMVCGLHWVWIVEPMMCHLTLFAEVENPLALLGGGAESLNSRNITNCGNRHAAQTL